MPQMLHDPPAPIIVLLRLDEPLPKPLILRHRSRANLLPRDSKLTAARRPNRSRHVVVSKHIPPDVGHRMFGMTVFFPRLAKRLDLVGASGHEDAAQVGVAIALYEADVQRLEGGYVVVGLGVRMPGFRVAVLVAVQEDDRLGEGGVVRNDVGQVGHCFAAFVDGRVQGRVGVVDRVDGAFPAGSG